MIKTIPEVIDKGVKGTDHLGRVFVEYDNKIVGLHNEWKNEKSPNHWVITGYEKRLENSESLYTSPLITKGETLPLNSIENNNTPKPLTSQEDLLKQQENLNKITKEPTHLSPLTQMQA
ncbi:hypothetical protein JP0576_10150 [Helicobacter pylori]